MAHRAWPFRPSETSLGHAITSTSAYCCAATRPLSARQVRWLLLKAEPELKPEQRQYLEHVARHSPEVVAAQQLILAFLRLLRKREPEALEPWLSAAQKSGLRRDKDAVMGALRYKESNGLSEEHINRLKMIKRTAYGRASFELLRKRVLARV